MNFEEMKKVIQKNSPLVQVQIAIMCAEDALNVFEEKYPDIDGPRVAIAAAKAVMSHVSDYVDVDTMNNTLSAAKAAYDQAVTAEINNYTESTSTVADNIYAVEHAAYAASNAANAAYYYAITIDPNNSKIVAAYASIDLTKNAILACIHAFDANNKIDFEKILKEAPMRRIRNNLLKINMVYNKIECSDNHITITCVDEATCNCWKSILSEIATVCGVTTSKVKDKDYTESTIVARV